MRFWIRCRRLEKRSQALRGRNLAIFLLAGGPVQFKRGQASGAPRAHQTPAGRRRQGTFFWIPGTPELCLKNPCGGAAFLQRPYVNVRTSRMNRIWRVGWRDLRKPADGMRLVLCLVQCDDRLVRTVSALKQGVLRTGYFVLCTLHSVLSTSYWVLFHASCGRRRIGC